MSFYSGSAIKTNGLKLAIAGIFFLSQSVFSQGEELKIEIIGQQIIPHEYKYKDTIVGGLSALDYNPESDSYVAICDDRSKYGPARFYGLDLNYDLDGFHKWKLTSVDLLKTKEGTPFPKPTFMIGKAIVDPEALQYVPNSDGFFWTSEGHAKHQVKPFVRQMTKDGSFIRDFAVPEKYFPTEDGERGVRDNEAFEAMTVDVNQKHITVTTEGPLAQDGERASDEKGANIRFLQFDIESGKPIHEFVYSMEPVHAATLPIGKFSINGVVDILSVRDGVYWVLERSFSAGSGLSVKLYQAEVDSATDVLKWDSLKGKSYTPMKKKLILDVSGIGIAIDNIEGMTFGKTLKDGRRSLLMISDDNFRSAQISQILAFAVSGL